MHFTKQQGREPRESSQQILTSAIIRGGSRSLRGISTGCWLLCSCQEAAWRSAWAACLWACSATHSLLGSRLLAALAALLPRLPWLLLPVSLHITNWDHQIPSSGTVSAAQHELKWPELLTCWG